MKKRFQFSFLILISVFLYLLTIRGSWGTPNKEQISQQTFVQGTPFESSQEQSRYATILSLYNDHTFNIDKYPDMGVPDVGIIKDHYYSIFPPGTSISALPFYTLGEKLNATQLFTFLVSTFFALLTMLLAVQFMHKLKMHWSTSIFAGFAFGFATNSWGYSVTLSAHLISAFLILAALYLLSFNEKKSFWKIILIWVLYGFAIFVDFPNLFIYLPIVGYLSSNIIELSKDSKNITFKINWKYAVAPFFFVVLMVLYGYYNYTHFGKITTLSNTIPRTTLSESQIEKGEPNPGTDPFSVLQTRNLLEGFNNFLISTDRGIVFYSPIILLFIFGMQGISKKNKKAKIALLSAPLFGLLIYSLFKDPYGGWAFGSRYLIPTMPELCILAAVGLESAFNSNKVRSILIRLIYTLIFIYSTAVSALAPLTTNALPPFIEARYLGADYTYVFNWKMLRDNKLNSFFWNHIVNKNITGTNYYLAIVALVVGVGTFLIWYPKRKP